MTAPQDVVLTTGALEAVRQADYDWPSAGFPGIKVDPESLRNVVVDQAQVESALENSTDPADHVFVALAHGELNIAAELIVQARMSDPGSLRLQILEADVAGQAKDGDRGVELLQQLVQQVKGKELEHHVRQHLGKAYFHLCNFRAAAASFAVALELRVQSHANANLIHSSAVALRRAQDLVELNSEVA